MDNTLPDKLSDAPFVRGRMQYQEAVRMRRESLREELGQLFPIKGKGSVALEIGAGHGHFLTAYAEAHPDLFCFGIDLIAERVRRGNKKRDRVRLENLCFLRCEAMEFLDCLPSGVCFDQVFVLFPDPWPKKKHHKNRLLGAPFFDALAERTVAESRLYFRTDFRPYFDEVERTVQGHPSWKTCEGESWPFEEVTVFQQRAAEFYSLIAARRLNPTAAFAEVTENPSKTSGKSG